jgi:hypothetical protein
LDKPSAFCNTYNAHFAQAQWTCGGGKGAAPIVPDAHCADLDVALANGQISYDPKLAAACLTEVDQGLGLGVDCAATPACVSHVIQGLVAQGDPCTHQMECPSGAGCGVFDGMSCPQHVCSAGSALMGEPCDATNGPQCAFGLACVSGTCGPGPTGAACPNGFTDCQFFAEFCGSDSICHPRVPIGSSCATDPTSCVILAACDSKTQLCVPAALKGQPCGALDICWTGTCIVPDANSSGVCGTALADGAACVFSGECASGVCSMAGTCATCP